MSYQIPVLVLQGQKVVFIYGQNYASSETLSR